MMTEEGKLSFMMSDLQLKHDSTSLEQLELPKIINKLQSLLSTPYGSRKIDTLDFSCDKDLIQAQLDEVAEMVGLLNAGHQVPLSGFSNIEPHLEKIKPENAHLESSALLDIKNNLQLMGELSHFFKTHRDMVSRLYGYAQGIHYHRQVIKEIESTMDPNGEINDKASPELREIRIKIRSLESEHKHALERLHKRYAEYSQDEIITLRDGRLVLGILPNYVNKVNGIVHGTSGSGATVFVEPMETLNISNQIQNLKIRERTEIIRILKFLTGLIRKIRHDILYGIENIAILDLILAKARLARELQAVAPKITEQVPLKIRQGRHPLLIFKMGIEQVVPLDLTLGENFTTLVITGPNAGGKTVAMKTVGLLLLMTQMGMMIPADPDSEIPLLPQILVDIGDRQSLEQDLSTFSAHIIRLQDILEKAKQDSLVLIDEIGTGTDPLEGSALAIAILSELTERQSLTIATTHHGQLKAFAHSRAQVENGSMEFDLDTLQPTYKLRTGIPGSSYALEIARRYGLNESLIENAKQNVGREEYQLEQLTLNLEERLQRLQTEHREVNIKLSEAEAMRNLYQRQLEDMKKHKEALQKQSAEDAQKILKDANALIERLVREIRESGASKTAIKTARDALEKQKTEVEEILSAREQQPAEMPQLKKGDSVHIETLNEDGELLEDVDGKNKVRVRVNEIKMTLDVTGLKKIEQPADHTKVIHKYSGKRVDQLGKGIGSELDLRGLDSEQAIEKTDQYLNSALESDWDEVRIVHGKGTGTLRKRINEFLARDKRVEEKRLGKWGEGDTGVTVVKLRK